MLYILFNIWDFLKHYKEKLTRAKAYTREEEKMILKKCDSF